ncbi:MAG: hypothetical protein ACRDCE_02915 [Cetobacterium sp.]|uniref:lysine 5,6-aminomutase reactivase subunit KamB n=1 Tax=Cetobacterium sp. TaxID=2071632 RepID=UPI0025F00CBF|nr:hypothetical protein [uncultured Cetobacterium sp.]
MPFIKDIKKYRSIATIGLEKNVGKTETMNYILKRFNAEGILAGVTSIGIDGEKIDIVTDTSKPEITIYEGMVFVTSEKHYCKKRFAAEILNVSEKSTALGRVVTARALGEGKVLLSGPSSSYWVKDIIDEMLGKGMECVLVDGALSRMSVGSPIITEGIVLSTGASVSINQKEIVKKTKHVINLLKLERVNWQNRESILKLEDGIYKIVLNGEIINKLPIRSILNFSELEENIFEEPCTLYLTGVLTERFVENLIKQSFIENVEILVKDFTKIFLSPDVLNRFIRRGGKLRVLLNTELVAVTVNPVSPAGYILDWKELVEEIKQFTDVPVLNLREEGYEI